MMTPEELLAARCGLCVGDDVTSASIKSGTIAGWAWGGESADDDVVQPRLYARVRLRTLELVYRSPEGLRLAPGAAKS